jgi:hypothetical protein
MDEGEADILKIKCGLHRHQNAAQAAQSKRHSWQHGPRIVNPYISIQWN